MHVKMWERQALGPRSKGTLLGFEEEGFVGGRKVNQSFISRPPSAS